MANVAAQDGVEINGFTRAGLVMGTLGVAGILLCVLTRFEGLPAYAGFLFILMAPVGFLLSVVGLWRIRKSGGKGRFPGVISLILNLPGTFVLVVVVIATLYFLWQMSTGAIRP